MGQSESGRSRKDDPVIWTKAESRLYEVLQEERQIELERRLAEVKREAQEEIEKAKQLIGKSKRQRLDRTG